MSDLNEEELRTVCRLSRLKLDESEIQAFLGDVKKIADYTKLLAEVDLSNLEPYLHAEEVTYGQLREDEPDNSLSRETFLENAPDHVGGMIRVPPVMKS